MAQVMQIQIDVAGLKKTEWHEYAIRFLFGGVITAIAGIIAKKFGPVVGGLFLAFPAIFPASATLIQKHEEQAKSAKCLNGKRRAREAVSADATGAAIGSIGLMVFGYIVWKALPKHNHAMVIAGATVVWISLSVAFWFLRKRM